MEPWNHNKTTTQYVLYTITYHCTINTTHTFLSHTHVVFCLLLLQFAVCAVHVYTCAVLQCYDALACQCSRTVYTILNTNNISVTVHSFSVNQLFHFKRCTWTQYLLYYMLRISRATMSSASLPRVTSLLPSCIHCCDVTLSHSIIIRRTVQVHSFLTGYGSIVFQLCSLALASTNWAKKRVFFLRSLSRIVPNLCPSEYFAIANTFVCHFDWGVCHQVGDKLFLAFFSAHKQR